MRFGRRAVLPRGLDKAWLASRVISVASERTELGLCPRTPVLVASLYVILYKLHRHAESNTAYGMVGTIIGYWLR